MSSTAAPAVSSPLDLLAYVMHAQQRFDQRHREVVITLGSNIPAAMQLAESNCELIIEVYEHLTEVRAMLTIDEHWELVALARQARDLLDAQSGHPGGYSAGLYWLGYDNPASGVSFFDRLATRLAEPQLSALERLYLHGRNLGMDERLQQLQAADVVLSPVGEALPQIHWDKAFRAALTLADLRLFGTDATAAQFLFNRGFRLANAG